MRLIDKITETSSRALVQRASRRSLLARLGKMLVGATSIPLLPVARSAEQLPQQPNIGAPQDAGDPTDCNYWRYCAMKGYLSAACGGSVNGCPPGTEMSPLTWIGTCRNPVDGRQYIISYNDCCGASTCGVKPCVQDHGDLPAYRSDKSHDYNWCVGTKSAVYNSSTAIVIGLKIGS